MKLLFELPPVIELFFSHCAPQNITWLFSVALRSPITNVPPPTARPKISLEAVFDVLVR